MRNRRKWPAYNVTLIALLFLLLLISFFWATALSQQVGESVTISEPTASDVYLAGQLVRVNADVDGDVTAAGREILINATITGDVIAAGERVDIESAVQDDIRAAGRIINISNAVDGHVVAAGAEITLAQNARVTDWAWLAGQRIEVRGNIGGELRAAGETVIVSGTVRGNADIVAERLRLEPGAVIEGNLVWRGETEPDVSKDARVGGDVVRKPIRQQMDERPSAFAGLFFVFAVFLLALVPGMLFPKFGIRTGELIRRQPWLTLGAAVLTLVVTPALIALCFATAIGFLVALTLMLMLLTMIVSGLAVGMLAVAHAGADAFNRPVTSRGAVFIALLAVALVLWVASWIPLLGGLVFLAVWLLGIGTTEVTGYRRLISTEN